MGAPFSWFAERWNTLISWWDPDDEWQPRQTASPAGTASEEAAGTPGAMLRFAVAPTASQEAAGAPRTERAPLGVGSGVPFVPYWRRLPIRAQQFVVASTPSSESAGLPSIEQEDIEAENEAFLLLIASPA